MSSSGGSSPPHSPFTARWVTLTSLATQYSQGTASEPRGTVWGTCSDRAGGALRNRLGLSSSVCAPSSCGLQLPPFLSYFIYQKNPYRHDCQTIFRCGESTRFVRQISLGETLQQRGEHHEDGAETIRSRATRRAG